MNKKFNTNEDRLENLKSRGNNIVESFSATFNKIKRVNEGDLSDEELEALAGEDEEYENQATLANLKEAQYEAQNPNKDEIIKMVKHTDQILDKKNRLVKVIEDNGLKVLYKIGPLQVFQDGISYEFNAQFTGSDGKPINNSDSKYRYFDEEGDMKTLEGDISIFQRSDMW